MLPFRIILLLTDGSDCSEHARQVALSLCRDQDARLIVLHVAPSQVVFPGPDDGPEETRPQLEKLESRLRATYRKDLDAHAEVHVREGEPTSAILALADEVNADLIVMGATGVTGCDDCRLGSVADEVIHKARCPVLTVRGPAVPEAASSPPPERPKLGGFAIKPRKTPPLRA